MLSFTVAASAQEALAGKGRFPQARSISGLSGGGAAVAPDGQPDTSGALSLSTPIGYTLSHHRMIMIGGTTSASRSPRWFDGNTNVNGSNGSAAMIVGIPVGNARLAISAMQTSRISEDRILSFQVSPSLPKGRLGVSFGIQDVFDQTVTTPNYHENARSHFAAGTYQAGKGVYVTLGGGATRFRKGFANASGPVGKHLKAVVEHDGFGWNCGVAARLGRVSVGQGSPADATLFVGMTQGKYVTWAIAFRH